MSWGGAEQPRIEAEGRPFLDPDPAGLRVPRVEHIAFRSCGRITSELNH
jgi:hypothetical protein